MRRTLAITLLLFILSAAVVYAGPLAKVYIAPGDIGLVTGAQQQLTVLGEDADGNPVTVPTPVNWSINSSAGTITSSGQLTAGQAPGRYWGAVMVSVSGGFTASANIEVYSNDSRSNYVIERSMGSLYGGALNEPTAMAIDRTGLIYIYNRSLNSISKIDNLGRYYESFKIADNFPGRVKLTVDNSQNIYILDCLNSHVMKYGSSGSFILQWGSAGTQNGQFINPHDIATDRTGRIYVADKGNKRVQVFDTGGVFNASWPIVDRYNYPSEPAAITVDRFNNLWVAAHSYDYDEILRFSPQGNLLMRQPADYLAYGCRALAVIDDDHLILLNGEPLKVTITRNAYQHADYQSLSLAAAEPGAPVNCSDVAVDGNGMAYIADADNNRILAFNSSGSLASEWSSSGGIMGRLKCPSSVITDSQGSIIVADSGNHRVQKFAINGSVTEFSSKWQKDSAYSCASAFTLDASGSLYLTDALNNRILGYNSSNQLISNITLPDPSGTSASAMGLVYDPAGCLFTVDAYNNIVRKLDMSGSVVTSWGSPGTANGQFDTPIGAARDSSGSIYISDYANNRIQKFNSSGGYLTKYGAPGTSTGQFNGPAGICIGPSDYLYIADRENGRVQKMSPAGAFSTPLGSGGYGKYEFQLPEGVYVDSQNRLFVADSGNNRIVKYTPYQTRPIAVSINNPTSWDSYSTLTPSFSFSGTVSGTGVTSITWTNDRGGSGSCTGLSNWTASGIMLSPGQNVVSVKAQNSTGSVVTDSIVVTYTPAAESVAPSVSINSPTTGSTYSTTNVYLNLAGTASDNVGVTSVIWSNNRGGYGTCSGTTSWSASSIILAVGENVITVAAYDLAGNVSTDTITVTFSDSIPPVITITDPAGRTAIATNDPDLVITGTAIDNSLISSIYCSYYIGSFNFIAPVWTLQPKPLVGESNYTITARDPANNGDQVTIKVFYATNIASNIIDAKKLSDYTSVYLTNKVVTAVFANGFYIEDISRTSGIKVMPISGSETVSVGDIVTVAGYIKSDWNKERYINGIPNKTGNQAEIAPVSMSCIAVGGGNIPSTGTTYWQRGVTGGIGLNNIGMLIRTWGKITQIGVGYMYIDDGSGNKDGTATGTTPNVGVRVICSTAGYAAGDYISVTGISSCYYTSGKYIRQVLTRGTGDVRKY